MSEHNLETPSAVETCILLEAVGVSKRFGRRWIFRSIDFSLSRGVVMVVTGPNGSGKSTLLQIVAGLQAATAGEVRGGPEDRRRWLSYAAIDQAVYPALTPSEHLELAGRLRGCASRERELLERVGLSQAMDRPAAQLSTGMRARLKLALAIQSEPEVLLLDEPGAGLDEGGRELVLSIIQEQRGRGAAIIATNDPAERRFASLELKLAG